MWTPILTGADAERARPIIIEIANAVHTASPIERASPLLAAQHALLYGYLEHTYGSSEYGELSAACVDRVYDALESLDGTPNNTSLFGGLAGIGWCFDRLRKLEDPLETEIDSNTDIDVVLGQCLDAEWRGHFDLVSGLVGIGSYLAGRSHRPGARAKLSRVFTHLVKLSESTPEGRCWFTGPELLDPSENTIAPKGYHNLGLAHGTPCVAAFLARLVRLGIEPAPARAVLTETMAWLHARSDRSSDQGPFFQSWIPTHDGPMHRLSWCYGDLGVGIGVLSAGLHTHHEPWVEWGTRILRACALRGGPSPSARDQTICHGSAGNAHLFNRAFHATGEADFRAAAVAWFRELLEKHRAGVGVGGYRFPGLKGWGNDTSLLEGSVGVALVLLAAISDVEPHWDGLLLCDLPIRDVSKRA